MDISDKSPVPADAAREREMQEERALQEIAAANRSKYVICRAISDGRKITMNVLDTSDSAKDISEKFTHIRRTKELEDSRDAIVVFIPETDGSPIERFNMF